MITLFTFLSETIGYRGSIKLIWSIFLHMSKDPFFKLTLIVFSEKYLFLIFFYKSSTFK
jgi:hypothetical protein